MSLKSITNSKITFQVNRGLGHITANSLSSSPKIRDIPIIKADSSTVPAAVISSSLIPLEKTGFTPFVAGPTPAISGPTATRSVSPPLTIFKPISLSTANSAPTSAAATNVANLSGLNLTAAGLGSRSNSTSPASTLSRVSTPHTIQSASSRPASIIITGKEKVLPR